ncbi:phage tail assembly protein [bacterium]|nr:phage tail assembly protein [bacterium]
MRKTKTIKLDDLEITFKELRVKDVRQLMDTGDTLSAAGDMIEIIDTILPLCCNLPKEKIEELAPSEMKFLYDAFMEVNSALFDALKKSGLMGVLGGHYQKILTALPAILSNAVTQTSSTTAGASS